MSFSSSVTVVETSLLSLLDYDTQLWPLAAISKAQWELWAPSCQSQSASNQGCCKLDPKTRMKSKRTPSKTNNPWNNASELLASEDMNWRRRRAETETTSLFVSGNWDTLQWASPVHSRTVLFRFCGCVASGAGGDAEQDNDNRRKPRVMPSSSPSSSSGKGKANGQNTKCNRKKTRVHANVRTTSCHSRFFYTVLAATSSWPVYCVSSDQSGFGSM
jgi:hypothetical protein